MKIYLAGKMDATNGSWRDGLLDSVYDYDRKRPAPRWEIVRKITDYHMGNEDDMAAPRWPQAENRHVLGLHDYVGPYRLTFDPSTDSKHSGYFHGSSARGQHGQMDEADRERIVAECLNGINRADFVFAYLNNPDCFGTVAEIGYAYALGKYIHVVVAEEACWDWDDYWFVTEGVAQASHDMTYDRAEGESIQDRVRRLFEGALVAWTGRTHVSPSVPVALAQANSEDARIFHEAALSFSQIARWSSDPRVRNEAQRMLKRIAG